MAEPNGTFFTHQAQPNWTKASHHHDALGISLLKINTQWWSVNAFEIYFISNVQIKGVRSWYQS